MNNSYKKWSETLAQAKAQLKKAEKNGENFGLKVYRWKHSKRKKQYFVGTYIEWLNQY